MFYDCNGKKKVCPEIGQILSRKFTGWTGSGTGLVLDTPYRERVIPVRRIVRNGRIVNVHAMGPGFSRSMGGGGPEHNGEIAEIPLYIVEADTGKEGIEAGETGVFKRASREAAANVNGKQGIPVGFRRNMPFGRTQTLPSGN